MKVQGSTASLHSHRGTPANAPKALARATLALSAFIAPTKAEGDWYYTTEGNHGTLAENWPYLLGVFVLGIAIFLIWTCFKCHFCPDNDERNATSRYDQLSDASV